MLDGVQRAFSGDARMADTFIFVHGAFGSPAELAPTVPLLEAKGHRVINVDLPCETPGPHSSITPTP